MNTKTFYPCENCGKDAEVDTKHVCCSYPPCYQYKCSHCGHVGYTKTHAPEFKNPLPMPDIKPSKEETPVKTDEEFLQEMKDKLSAYQSTLDHFSEPIYEIRVCDYVNNFNVWESMGYYRNLDDAINCVLENRLDFHEDCYDDCFILCRFEGVYNDCDYRGRLYFSWDYNEGRYRPAYEPRCYRKTSFI